MSNKLRYFLNYKKLKKLIKLYNNINTLILNYLKSDPTQLILLN